MAVTDWYRFFSWLALLALAVLAAGLIVFVGGSRVARLRSARRSVRRGLAEQGLALTGLVAVVATAGSLYLSEGAHLVPCRLCWFQRIAMYPLAVMLAIAAVRRDWSVRPYAITLAASGLVISTWHYLIEWFPSLEGVGGRCDPTNPCSALPLARRYGFVSIPFMAGVAFVAVIAGLAGASRVRRYR